MVTVSFVELSTLVYPISKSGPTQTSVLVVAGPAPVSWPHGVSISRSPRSVGVVAMMMMMAMQAFVDRPGGFMSGPWDGAVLLPEAGETRGVLVLLGEYRVTEAVHVAEALEAAVLGHAWRALGTKRMGAPGRLSVDPAELAAEVDALALDAGVGSGHVSVLLYTQGSRCAHTPVEALTAVLGAVSMVASCTSLTLAIVWDGAPDDSIVPQCPNFHDAVVARALPEGLGACTVSVAHCTSDRLLGQVLKDHVWPTGPGSHDFGVRMAPEAVLAAVDFANRIHDADACTTNLRACMSHAVWRASPRAAPDAA